jgi:hypothetical protein
VPTNQTAFTASTVIFNSLAVGTPRLSYQWTFNGVAIDNATNAQLRLVNVQGAASGIYSVAVTNDYGAVGTNANLVVQPFGLSTFPTNLLMTTNGFQLQVDGVFATNSLVVYASTNLVDWLSIFTNPPATGSLRFLNSNALSRPVQFYRAVEQ